MVDEALELWTWRTSARSLELSTHPFSVPAYPNLVAGSLELTKIKNRKKASRYNNADSANLSEMTRPPVRFAPSMLKQQSCRGSGRGFCRMISAASFRFCLGSPRICRTQPTREEHFDEHPAEWGAKRCRCLCTYSDFDFRILQDNISDRQHRFCAAVVQQQNCQAY